MTKERYADKVQLFGFFGFMFIVSFLVNFQYLRSTQYSITPIYILVKQNLHLYSKLSHVWCLHSLGHTRSREMVNISACDAADFRPMSCLPLSSYLLPQLLLASHELLLGAQTDTASHHSRCWSSAHLLSVSAP